MQATLVFSLIQLARAVLPVLVYRVREADWVQPRRYVLLEILNKIDARQVELSNEVLSGGVIYDELVIPLNYLSGLAEPSHQCDRHQYHPNEVRYSLKAIPASSFTLHFQLYIFKLKSTIQNIL